jgi:hypothetical protein
MKSLWSGDMMCHRILHLREVSTTQNSLTLDSSRMLQQISPVRHILQRKTLTEITATSLNIKSKSTQALFCCIKQSFPELNQQWLLFLRYFVGCGIGGLTFGWWKFVGELSV